MTRLRLACCLAMLAMAAPVQAALKCAVSTPTLAFGNYSPGTTQNLDTTATVDIDCKGSRGIVSIALSAGNSGNMENRYMLSAGNTLSYNAYLNAARTIIWGDGSGSTVAVFRNLPPGRNRFGIPVYGRVFAGQDPAPGTYTDSVVVTAYF